MRSKIIIIIFYLFGNLLFGSEEWRGLNISGMVIRGGFDNRGDKSNYSLLIRFSNDTDHPVKIKYHELCNATLNVVFINTESEVKIEAKPGRTGNLIPKEFPDSRESIEIGSGTTVVIAISLDGFEDFSPGKYKGQHKTFGLDIPQFQITKSGDVISIR